MAVDDMASAPPTINATGSVTSNAPHSRQVVSAVVSTTWAPPMPSASSRIDSMRGSENSNPKVNTRNTTPKSDSTGAMPSVATSSAYGPSSMPTER